MLLTPHILAGAAIITLIQNPILGLIFVLMSHYLLDLPPHIEYSIDNIKNGRWRKSLPDFLKAFLDAAVGMTIVFFTADHTPIVLIAAFLAIFPDGLTILYCIFPSNGALKKYNKIHSAINNVFADKKISAFWRVASQAVVIAVAIYFLL